MINPYKDIDWVNVLKIPACSHQHCETQAQFNNIVASGMYETYAISNYYPSKPIYPLSDKFTDVPVDAISCPNAEHHNMSNNGSSLIGLHVNGLGCTKVSGSERHYEDGHWVNDEPVGFDGLDWRQAFTQILNTQLYSDGGGITINHPNWSRHHGGLPQSVIEQMLNYDYRVLGIEVWNANYESDEDYNWDWELWDAILRKGKRCWGFAASDHTGQNSGSPEGRNILLCNSADTYECLKAYREGRFYCQRKGTSLAFSSIAVSGGKLNVATIGASTISVVIDSKKKTYSGNSVSVSIPNNVGYMRIEAASADDIIWSNPIMFDKKNSFNKLIPFM